MKCVGEKNGISITQSMQKIKYINIRIRSTERKKKTSPRKIDKELISLVYSGFNKSSIPEKQTY